MKSPMMKNPLTLLLALSALAAPVFGQPAADSGKPAATKAPAGRLSPHETATGRVDGANVLIVYGRPHLKDPKSGAERTVWGGQLVPADKIWRTGADEATLLITQKPLVFGTTTVPAGVYSLFTAYAADGSAKLVVNRKIGQWGIGPGAYEAAQDVVEVPMTKTSLPAPAEQFTMAVAKNPAGGGAIELMWADTQYAAPFTVAK